MGTIALVSLRTLYALNGRLDTYRLRADKGKVLYNIFLALVSGPHPLYIWTTSPSVTPHLTNQKQQTRNYLKCIYVAICGNKWDAKEL